MTERVVFDPIVTGSAWMAIDSDRAKRIVGNFVLEVWGREWQIASIYRTADGGWLTLVHEVDATHPRHSDDGFNAAKAAADQWIDNVTINQLVALGWAPHGLVCGHTIWIKRDETQVVPTRCGACTSKDLGGES